jgi:hypothetical protein
MPRVYKLEKTGRPWRALQVLGAADRPLTEAEVHAELSMGVHDMSTWDIPLGKLVIHDLATRMNGTGEPAWEITDKGRTELGIVMESLL